MKHELIKESSKMARTFLADKVAKIKATCNDFPIKQRKWKEYQVGVMQMEHELIKKSSEVARTFLAEKLRE